MTWQTSGPHGRGARPMSPPRAAPAAGRLAPWPVAVPRGGWAAPAPRAPDERPPATPWAGVRWTPLYLAFLAYIFAVTTYLLPIGDVAIAAGLILLPFQREKVRAPRFLVWLGLFVLWCGIGYLFTSYRELAAERLVMMAKLWLILLVATNAIRTRAQARFFIIFFLACFALFPLRGAIFNYYLYSSSKFGRAIWNHLFSDPNDLAALSVLQLSLVAGLLPTERAWWVRWAAVAGLGALSFLILLTQSRGGFLAFSLFALLCVVGQRREIARLLGRARRARVALGLAAIAVVVAIAAPTGVWRRVRGLKNATSVENMEEGKVDPEGSAFQRYQIWRVATSMAADNPVVGVGVGAYGRAHYDYWLAGYMQGRFHRTAGGVRDTHSTYLNALAETGIPGLILYILVFATTAVWVDRVRRECRAALPRAALQLLILEYGLLAFFAAAIFGSFVNLPFPYLQLVLMWALAAACREQLRQPQAPPPPMRARPGHDGVR